MSSSNYRILDWLPDYGITEDGEVWRITPRRNGGPQKALPYALSQSLVSGYPTVAVSLPSGESKRLLTHRLVCEAFHGAAPEGKIQCAHRNGVKTDNRAANLYWADAKENAEDRELHGKTIKGSKSHRAKLSEDDVYTIRDLYEALTETPPRARQSLLAEMYGVTRSAVSGIVYGRTWSHLNGR